VDDELCAILKHERIRPHFHLSVQSGSDRILKLMKKNLNVKKIKEKIKLIEKNKINIAGFFILGFPTETKKEIYQTINLSLQLPLVRANFFTFLPFPGTESYELIMKENRKDKIDWKKFYFMNAAYTPETISRQELKNLQRKAFFKFFFRYKIFFYNISKIKNYNHFKFLFKRFINWIIKSD